MVDKKILVILGLVVLIHVGAIISVLLFYDDSAYLRLQSIIVPPITNNSYKCNYTFPDSDNYTVVKEPSRICLNSVINKITNVISTEFITVADT